MLIVIFAVVLLAAVLVLWPGLWTAESSHTQTSSTLQDKVVANASANAGGQEPSSPSASSSAEAVASTPSGQTPEMNPSSTTARDGALTATAGRDEPALATSPTGDEIETNSQTDGSQPRVYVRDDGALVRDHRGASAKPMMHSTSRRPNTGSRKADPRTVVAVRNAVRPLVRACSETLDKSNWGSAPAIQTEVVIRVESGDLTVDRAYTQSRDVADDQREALTTCVTGKVEAVELRLGEQADISEYTLTLPFRLRW